ncbi:hypothetical protein [Enhygromyxa salina]|nr:hypothetical protein [Enhygromyxa salina]
MLHKQLTELNASKPYDYGNKLGVLFGALLFEVAVGLLTGGAAAATSKGVEGTKLLADFPRLQSLAKRIAAASLVRAGVEFGTKIAKGARVVLERVKELVRRVRKLLPDLTNDTKIGRRLDDFDELDALTALADHKAIARKLDEVELEQTKLDLALEQDDPDLERVGRLAEHPVMLGGERHWLRVYREADGGHSLRLCSRCDPMLDAISDAMPGTSGPRQTQLQGLHDEVSALKNQLDNRRITRQDLEETMARFERELTDLEVGVKTPAHGSSLTADFQANIYRRVEAGDLTDADKLMAADGTLLEPHPSDHSMPKPTQAQILNDREHLIYGWNRNGRAVNIYLRDGMIVVTQHGNNHRIITAYGGAYSKSGKPLTLDRWRGQLEPGEVYHILRRSDAR